MELDPIVLLAYVSVAVNILTVIVATVAYLIFRIRKRRRSQPMANGAIVSEKLEPVFLRPYYPAIAVVAQTSTEPAGETAVVGH